MRRERQPQGTTYSMVVVVQHHALFVTDADRAYEVSCFYREGENRLEQTLEINDVTTAGLSEEQRLPDCAYSVLQGAPDGEPVKFANVGELLVHKWACKTGERGFLEVV